MSSLRVITTEIEDPRDLIAALPLPGGIVWSRAGEGAVAWGEAARFEPGPGEDRFERARAWFDELCAGMEIDDEVSLPGSGPVAFGAFAFDPRSDATVLIVPEVSLWRRGGRAWMTVVGDGDASAVTPVPVRPTGRIRYAGSTVDDVSWLEIVETITSEIATERVDKVVLARDLLVWAKEDLDPRALSARLAERYPECFTFAIDGFVGASPELLFGRAGEQIGSLVLAGTAARAGDPATDDRLGAELMGSGKNREEHAISVASVRSVLDPLCSDLSVGDEPFLLKLANVQHLATAVTGTLHAAHASLDVVAALHPSAAVCGMPKEEALGLIRKLEGMERGRYAGPVGWIDARGDCEWAIGLRCAEVSGSRARLFAGNGMVAGSIPEAELEETRLKLKAMQAALGE